MRFFVIDTNSEHYVASSQHSIVAIAQATRLGRTAGSIIFGIKIEDNFFTLKIGQFNDVSVLILCFEQGSFFAYLQCHVFYG